MSWCVYILRCQNGAFYTGCTNHFEKRLRQHKGLLSGGAKYTRANPPEETAAVFPVPDKSTALRLERAIKRLTHAQKSELIQSGMPAVQHLICSMASESKKAKACVS